MQRIASLLQLQAPSPTALTPNTNFTHIDESWLPTYIVPSGASAGVERTGEPVPNDHTNDPFETSSACESREKH